LARPWFTEDMLGEVERVAAIGSFEWDVARNRVSWTDGLYRIYGLTPQSFEATFEAFLAQIHEEDRDRVRKTIMDAYEAKSSFRMEERIFRPTGEERQLSSWGEVVLGEKGEVARILGICQDVTEQRAAEAERERLARESRETASALQDAKRSQEQALELNDAVVQGLAVAKLALAAGDTQKASETLEHTLDASKAIVTELLRARSDKLKPGDFVRSDPDAPGS